MTRSHIDGLRRAERALLRVPFPPGPKWDPSTQELDSAWAELVAYDAEVVGCIRQLVGRRAGEWNVDLCRRVLIVDEALTERIRSAPDDASKPVKEQLLARKATLDDLIRLAQPILRRVQRE